MAKPRIHLTGAPECTSLRYRLSVRAEDVELNVVNTAGHEVWDVDRERTGVAPGQFFAFRWCGEAKAGHRVTPGRYRWRIEVDQAGSSSEARSGWRMITASR